MTWKKWLWLPVLVVAAVVAIFVSRRRNPMKFVETELKAIDAATATKKRMVRQGAEVARAHVELQHKKALENLDEDQRKKADALRSDPVRLSKFLVRVGGG